MERNRKRKLVTLAAVGLISLPTVADVTTDSADKLEGIKKDDAFHQDFDADESHDDWRDAVA